MNFYSYKTKLGEIGIGEEGGYITNIYLSKESFPKEFDLYESPVIKEAAKQLAEYLAGKRKIFDLPIKMQGTEFMIKVWKALQTIPYGEVTTYKDIAERVGCPKGFRAVGMANNKNKLPILVPCHRIIGSDGSLTGFAYGLEMKEKLLQLERS